MIFVITRKTIFKAGRDSQNLYEISENDFDRIFTGAIIDRTKKLFGDNYEFVIPHIPNALNKLKNEYEGYRYRLIDTSRTFDDKFEKSFKKRKLISALKDMDLDDILRFKLLTDLATDIASIVNMYDL